MSWAMLERCFRHQAGDASRPLEELRILFVDPDSEVREVLAHLLEQAGAIVLTAGGAREALTLARRSEIDVLVIEPHLHGRSGYRLLCEIRRIARGRHGGVGALALTAVGTEGERAAARAAGFEAFMLKPAAAEELLSTLALRAGGRRRDSRT